MKFKIFFFIIKKQEQEQLQNKINEELKESNIDYDQQKLKLLKYQGPGKYSDIKKLTN